MKFLPRYVLVVAALMAGALLLAACGGNGGEELSLDEYFQRLEDIKEAAEERSDTLEQEFLGTGEEVEVGSFQEYFGDFLAIFGDALNDVKDLDPPAEAQDAHDEFVAAMGEARGALEDLRDRVADVESFAEMEALISGPEGAEFEAAAEGFEAACLDLQGIADENSIDVDLRCKQ